MADKAGGILKPVRSDIFRARFHFQSVLKCLAEYAAPDGVFFVLWIGVLQICRAYGIVHPARVASATSLFGLKLPPRLLSPAELAFSAWPRASRIPR